MDDEAKTVADYKIVENGFIVMMTVKVSRFHQSATPFATATAAGSCADKQRAWPEMLTAQSSQCLLATFC